MKKTINLLINTILLLALLGAMSGSALFPSAAHAETQYQVPVFVSDWTGEYTTSFETYRSQSLVYPWGSEGPAVFISKKDFITMTGFFGAILAGIITWALYRAVL